MAERSETRCLLCSLCCPVTVERASDGVLAVDTAASSSTGLCGRGCSLAELAGDPRRLTGARRQNGDAERLSLGAAAEAFNGLLAGSGDAPVAVVVDGNLPCEDIVAVHHWARTWWGKAVVAVHLPPPDLDFMEGLSASRASPFGPGGLASSDNVVVVGDALRTHPVLGRSLLDWKYSHPNGALITVDTHASVTSHFGTVQFRAAPGAQGEALRATKALLKDANASPPTPGLTAVRGSWAELGRRLQANRHLSVIVVPEMTKDIDWSVVAVLAAELAEAGAGGVLPLYSYGNAVGAYRIMANLGLHRLEELLVPSAEGAWAAVVEIGCDLSSAYPGGLMDPLFAGGARRIALTCLPSPSTETADLVIGLAHPSEYTGTVVAGSGDELSLGAGHSMPGTTGVSGFFGGLMDGPHPANESAWRDEPAAGPIPPTAGLSTPAADGDALLLAVGSSIHAGDGALTRRASWAQHFEGEPVLRLAARDAERRGLANGRLAAVETENGAATMACQIDASLPPGLMLAPAAFAEVRRLLPWQLSADRLRCPPARATVKAATQEG